MKVASKLFPLSLGLLIAVALATGAPSPSRADSSAQVRLAGHVPARSMASAKRLGRMPAVTQVRFSFTLPLRNQQELDTLLQRIYDPADPLYRHYLTPGQFNDRFAPGTADYEAVKRYARGLGLTITGTHANRTILDVAGPAAVVEAAFDMQMHQYQAHTGHNFVAPDREPCVPAAVASCISGMVGLDTAARWQTHSHAARASEVPMATPYQIGTGPGGGMTPKDITTAYNLSSVTATGTGQTLALFQLDGYTASDVTAYANYYGIRAVPLQNVLVDGFSGAPGSGAGEVTLDIELQMALAPGASKIIVYQGPNTGKGVLDTYNRIATDNLAKQVSSSWGLSEGESGSSFLSSENAIFQQMAAQGQSVYAASGDSGAYDNGSTLSVDDPASQPYVTGVGGTTLYLSSGSYNRESTWSAGTITGGAGGGGVSAFWPIPSWQQKLGNVASSVMRNVPDVALNSDPGTGYSIYYQGKWWVYGGTSCAAPLWAAFTARVNQQRAAGGLAPLGFANPVLYQVGAGSGYGTSFHDIADSTTNLYYPAITGYDNATGWGSFNGANLLAALAPASSGTTTTAPKVTVPAAPAGLKATAGNASVALSWSASSGATSYNVYRGTAAGKEGTTPVRTSLTATSFTDSVANGVTYYYKVAAVNSAGTSALSNEVYAKSTAPLAFTTGVSGTIGTTTAKIQWSTSLPSTSVVRYGTSSGSLTKARSNSKLVTSHVVTLSSLARRTTYYFQASSSAGSSTATSPIYYFRTQ